MNFERASGILLHPTSLPGRYGIGTLGKEAYDFVDFLIKSGQKLWQICPLGPTGYGDSPYQCFSAFAGNHLLIDFDVLLEEKLLKKEDIDQNIVFSPILVEYGKVIDFKNAILKKSYKRFIELKSRDKVLSRKYENFCEANIFWLEDYSLFMAIKESLGMIPWSDWDKPLKFRDKPTLDKYKTKLKDLIDYHKYLQYIFYKQWFELKSYANQNNIKIIGDIPIYIAGDSSDCWANVELFQFDENRNPKKVAGVPPDYFSATGQLWGNPVYDWDNALDKICDWWIKRIQSALKSADIVRIDHFRGFAGYWAVPYGEKTAINGEWYRANGDYLFDKIKRDLGKLPIIAEDLGVITPDVERLLKKYGLPGMKILQFAFDSEEASAKNFIPHVYVKDCVCYTGTHDNSTVVGWYNDAKEVDKKYAEEYLDVQKGEVNWAFIKGAISSVAVISIVPLQDVLGLGDEARMNYPGKFGGNWAWRYTKGKITDKMIERLRKLTKLYGR
ncbi:MAG TPA: 4-alpha-glucanotransferase [Spirochaetota bacterium]|jgi:4-alpha-glucanotransferase|nr:MAG: 4-alpha-glucanotransferase [Firmicutes bacterium ADurb.Bin193]HNZ28144.1 4-alpha-glucanotransferase [Spirochaetota bacterium]HPY88384.1 4-alpha-glucanotransferase [Spirochaetota bacterium]HQB61728.1 4-alpha-glucanotransferase [Spirochaetota bacterium]